MSTRAGGVSGGAFDSLNLGVAVGDEPEAVAENRRRFAAALGAEPVFLRQVHGTRVVRLPLAGEVVRQTVGNGGVPLRSHEAWSIAGKAVPQAGGSPTSDGGTAPEADASFTTEPGMACVIQAADCLPVLFAAPNGRGVAAAHAGWRGLAAGVLEQTVAALCKAAGCTPEALRVWLGPCIGPRQFEVGAEVPAAFGVERGGRSPRFEAQGGERWLADLPGLARDRLTACGVDVNRIGGGHWCTVEDESRFFSHRRDRPRLGSSGRLAAAIWIERA
ncbi:MAG: peptidoglycan editing factor PgeF [Methylibium sp.]|nr:peptidoglycan editing factor PgeF [Methylibium sp.]